MGFFNYLTICIDILKMPEKQFFLFLASNSFVPSTFWMQNLKKIYLRVFSQNKFEISAFLPKKSEVTDILREKRGVENFLTIFYYKLCLVRT